MERHYHIEDPFCCICATMWGWAIGGECKFELVEVCSDNILGDVHFAPNLDGVVAYLTERGVKESEILALRERIQKSLSGSPLPS
jgi:hypothetical protein